MIEGPTVMYSSHSQAQSSMENMVGNVIDGSGTINPAALNQSGVLPTPTSLTNTSPRGLKRSRSPDQYANAAEHGGYDDDNDDSRPKKRGRPPKAEELVVQPPGQAQPGQLPTPVSAQPGNPSQLPVQQQPQTAQQSASQPAAPKQTSPAKPASGKPVVKALPTVRDHTTDQLGPERDEYLPREVDDAGENKVHPNGRLLGGREYKCRTFLVPNRGDKLFMLATECARILGYRDSYLLFNKNRSLYKIIATQAEKEDLIHQDILPYSYRSRQIAIVTAKSMFRQFGSRVVVNGRRVRDDYWEAKARKQGFTEEDMAGEKRPGAAKREAQAQDAAANAAAGHPPGNIVYQDLHGTHHPAIGAQMLPNYGTGQHFPQLPMIDSGNYQHVRDYGDLSRPRQELSGPSYQDRTLPSSMTEIMNQANHAQDFNKSLNSQRGARAGILNDYWKKEQPVSSPVQDSTAAPSTSLASPHLSMTGGANQQQMLPPQPGQQGYPSHQGGGQGSPQALRQPIHRQPSIYGNSGPVPQSPSYGGYPQNQSWQQQPQPIPSPISSQQQFPSPATPGQHTSSQSPHPGHAGPPNMYQGQPPHLTQPSMQQPGAMGPMQGYHGMQRPVYQQNAYSTPGATAGMNPAWQPGQQNWQPQY